MENYILEIKAFHVIAFMSWMAMLFYLPRLFVYHVEHKDKEEFGKVAQIQEEKLYKFIGLPAFIATVASGIALIIINPSLFKEGWLHVKLLILVLLIAYSFSLDFYRKQLKKGTCKKSGKFFRAYNEIPTLLSIIIVVCAIMKDFFPVFTLCITVLFIFICFMIMRKK
jgi:putative membrane protein